MMQQFRTLRHIRYGDFRGWQSPSTYQSALLDLLRAIGITTPPANTVDLVWYVRLRTAISTLRTELLIAAGVLDGALLIGSMLPPDYNQRSAVRYGLIDPNVLQRLQTLHRVMPATSEWLWPLRDAIAQLQAVDIQEAAYTRVGSSKLLDLLYGIASKLQTLEDDVSNLSFTPVSFEQADLAPLRPTSHSSATADRKTSPLSYDVTLLEIGPNRLLVMRALRRLLAIPLAELTSLSSRLPCLLKSNVAEFDAQSIRTALMQLGADVTIEPA